MNKTKKGIVAFLLTAALLISMVGMASAATSQKWYLTDTSAGAPTGADYIMYKGSGAGSITPIALGTTAKVWAANEVATVNVPFGADAWPGWFDYAESNELCSGDSITIEVGYLDPDTSTFHSKGSMTHAPTACKGATDVDALSASAFTVPIGDYLAVRAVMVEFRAKVGHSGIPPCY